MLRNKGEVMLIQNKFSLQLGFFTPCYSWIYSPKKVQIIQTCYTSSYTFNQPRIYVNKKKILENEVMICFHVILGISGRKDIPEEHHIILNFSLFLM